VGVAIMNYATALQFFAFMLALIGVGLIAIVAHFAHASSAVAPEPATLRAATPHMPAGLPRGGVRCLIVSLVWFVSFVLLVLLIALALACGVIVWQ
jgi:hypothetical protein